MVVAVVVSHLANSAKRHTTIARNREREMSDLYAFSRRLPAAPSASEIFVAIQNHLANLVQRKVLLLGTADTGKSDTEVPDQVRAEVAHTEHDEGPWSAWSTTARAMSGTFAGFRRRRPTSG